jgi:hypothetical protein
MSTELLITGTVIGYAGAAYAAWHFLRKRRLERERKDLEFVSQVVSALSNKSIKTFDDISDLYMGFFLGRESDFPNVHRIATLLRRAKLNVSVSKENAAGTNAQSLELINKLLATAKEHEKEQRAKAPFSGVPSPERSLLEDVREVSGARDNQFIQDKLSELATAIKIRQDTVEKLGEEKGRSLKWAKWGVAGTVFFSLLSIGITYYFSVGTS